MAWFSKWLIILLITLPAISACLGHTTFFPLPGEEKKYPPEVLSQFTPGQTTQQQVRESLGKPEISMRNGTQWVYWASNQHAKTVHNPGPDPRDETYQILSFQFQHGLVAGQSMLEHEATDFHSFYGSLGSWWACTESGACIIWGPLFRKTRSLEPWRSVVVSRGEDDQAAKRFLQSGTICNAYIYSETTMHGGFHRPSDVSPDRWGSKGSGRKLGPPEVSIADVNQVTLHSRGFIKVTLETGEHVLKVAARFLWLGDLLRVEEYPLECRSGEPFFIKINFIDHPEKIDTATMQSRRVIGKRGVGSPRSDTSRKMVYEITKMPNEQGREAILARNLQIAIDT